MSDAGTEATETLTDVASELYRQEPSAFVAARDGQVRRLRDAGRRDLASEVAALRKPTLPAWAVDQVALRDAGGLEALVEAGDRARAAQRDGGDAARTALQELRAAVAAARDRAGEHLQAIGVTGTAHLEEVEQTLLAVATDPTTRPAALAGRLTRPLPPPGLDALVSPAPAPGATPEDELAARRRERERERAREDARRAAARLTDERAALAAERDERQRHLAALRSSVDAAEAEVAADEDRLADLDRSLAEAHDRLEALEQEGDGEPRT